MTRKRRRMQLKPSTPRHACRTTSSTSEVRKKNPNFLCRLKANYQIFISDSHREAKSQWPSYNPGSRQGDQSSSQTQKRAQPEGENTKHNFDSETLLLPEPRNRQLERKTPFKSETHAKVMHKEAEPRVWDEMGTPSALCA